MELFIGIVALIVSGLVLFISWQRFKLDLFKERLAVYGQMRNVLKDARYLGEIKKDKEIEFNAARFRAKFLFGREMHRRLQKYRDAITEFREAATQVERQDDNEQALQRLDDAKKFLYDVDSFDKLFEHHLMISGGIGVWLSNLNKS